MGGETTGTQPASAASAGLASLASSLQESPGVPTSHSPQTRHFAENYSSSEPSPDTDVRVDHPSAPAPHVGGSAKANSEKDGESVPKEEEKANSRKHRRGSAPGEAVQDELLGKSSPNAGENAASGVASRGPATPESKRRRETPAASEATETQTHHQGDSANGDNKEGPSAECLGKTPYAKSLPARGVQTEAAARHAAAANPPQKPASGSDSGKPRDDDSAASEQPVISAAEAQWKSATDCHTPAPLPAQRGDAGGSSVHTAHSGRVLPRHGAGSSAAKQEEETGKVEAQTCEEDAATHSMFSDAQPASPSPHFATVCSSAALEPLGSQPRSRRGCRRPEATASPALGSSDGDFASQTCGSSGPATAASGGSPTEKKVLRSTLGEKTGDGGGRGTRPKTGKNVEPIKPEKRANGVTQASPAGDCLDENGVSREFASDADKKLGAGGRDDGSTDPAVAENACGSAEARGKVPVEQMNGTHADGLPNAKRRRQNFRNARQSPSMSPSPSVASPLSATKAEMACSPQGASTPTASEQLSNSAACKQSERDREESRSRPMIHSGRDGLAGAEGPASASGAGAASGPSSAGPPVSSGPRPPSRESSAAPAAYAGSGMSTRKRRAQSAAAAAGAAATGESLEGLSSGGEKGASWGVREGSDASSPGQGTSDARASKKGGGQAGGGAGERGAGQASSPGGTPGWGDATAAVGGAASDPGAAARFSARLRQRPGDARAALAARAYNVLPVPSPYVNSKVRCCCCGTGVGSSAVLLGGFLGSEDPALAAQASGAGPPGATGPEGPAGADPSASGAGVPDGVLILPRRISANAYNNLEIRARYDICQRRIRKVEAWLQMIEEWYFGSAAPRWQSLHQQTVQQELVAAVNSTKRSRRIEAVRGGGDASAGLVEAPVPVCAPPWAGSSSKGSGADGGKSGGTSGSGGIYGLYSEGSLAAGGGAGADTGSGGALKEGRVNLEGGLATADSVIYALIVSNNVGRSTASGVYGGSHGAGGGGDSGREAKDGSGAFGAAGAGGGRKGEGGASTKSAAGGKGSRGGGAAGAAPRLGAVKLSPLELLTSPLRKDNVIDLWGPKEVALFEAGICKYGKDFSALQRLIQTKTTCEIVDFYYLWKQTNRYLAWKQHRHLSKTILHSVFG
ncbi:putative Myb-like DNA-binding domain protein [Toxoplasma gondii MAS]|uniref:Putative Myb-like DNA-binding domain protein n=5 Tax=Toxoplasma gondii TaxID=5811 RepID=A0A086QUR0_TOXGO|nr:putative Myb-like DNA-binding domain protein [Toxoplasma gondii FOU]KFH16342.1 putative Myb-like DNA-binding domain protein [Toxoplasma gondii MAS]PUA86500.1 putative Myb-like DNA-binding domain protein [Toxoplasma gondii TgCATBr9]RQX70046.1 putative Myb-like DNA-binding domain protein [Toxoplasma gondii CAST]